MTIVTHRQLAKLLTVLYGRDVSSGVCHGIACMTLRAFFLGGMDRFTERLELLGTLVSRVGSAGITLEQLANGLKYSYDDKNNLKLRKKLGQVPGFWDDIKNYLDPSQCQQNLDSSEANEENWNKVRIDILAFLDGVSLNFNTRNHPKLFPEGTMLGQNPELSLPITWFGDSPPSRTASFSGIYNRSELIGYFNALNGLAQSRNEQIGFMLNSHKHAISLGYDPVGQQWLLFDSNKLPVRVIENGEQFAAEIRSSFREEGEYACFSTDCYQIPSEHNLTKGDFNSISEWSELHAVTSERAGFKARDNVSWLYIAAKNEHVEVVEALLKNDAVRTFIREKTHEPFGITLLKMLSNSGIDGSTLCELLLFVEPNRVACFSLLEQMTHPKHSSEDLIRITQQMLASKEAEANERAFDDLKLEALQACDRYNDAIGQAKWQAFFRKFFVCHQNEEKHCIRQLKQDLEGGLITNIKQLRARITSIIERVEWPISNDIFSEINLSGVESQSREPSHHRSFGHP